MSKGYGWNWTPKTFFKALSLEELRADPTTSQPSWIKRRLKAAPIPELAPVTQAQPDWLNTDSSFKWKFIRFIW
jgi:hypothetical protein